MIDFSMWELFFFQAEDGIRDSSVTGVQTCALPISVAGPGSTRQIAGGCRLERTWVFRRSEEHTSELQSHLNIVCRLLLEKKNIQLSEEHAESRTTPLSSLFYTTPPARRFRSPPASG